MTNYLEVTNLSKSFDSFQLHNISFTLPKGYIMGLIGPNGSGKTTTIKLILNMLKRTGGTVKVMGLDNIAEEQKVKSELGVVFDTNYFSDDWKVSQVEKSISVFYPNWDSQKFADMLRKFHIAPTKKVKELSKGMQMKLMLACAFSYDAKLLILDEPTNHMDMRSKDILKNAIMKYDGTVIVVSHDREFLDGMVSKVYEFRNGGVREYLGGIYYFLEKRKLESLQEVERKDAPAKEAAPKASSSGKLTYEQKKEQEKLLRKLRKAVETIEASLADLEKKIADYDRKFAEATQYNEADYKAYNELKAEYDHQMHEWEKASYELEITEGE